MAKYNNNTESVCDKIRNAKLGPFFGFGKFRKANLPLPTKNPISIEIPIESSPQILPSRMKNGQVIEVAVVTPKNEPKSRGPLKGQQQVKFETSLDNGEEDINGKSSFYIDRVKNKMRAKSNIDGENHWGKRDSFNDKVSSYINRAKIKLRTTSSIGGGK